MLNHVQNICSFHIDNSIQFETSTLYDCNIAQPKIFITKDISIKSLTFYYKTGTTNAQKSWFKVGDYKMIENKVGGSETVRPEDVAAEMKALIADYNSKSEITFDDILDFHVRFESIHPFQTAMVV